MTAGKTTRTRVHGGTGDAPLLLGQALGLAGLAWPGRPRWSLPLPVAVAAVASTAAGGSMAGRAAVALGAHLTPRVEPPQGAPLRTKGPFAVSRHPVYTGLLGVAAGVAVLRRRPEPLVALGVLAAVLHVKAGHEEEAMRRRFGSRYDAYAASTPRLLAWR